MTFSVVLLSVDAPSLKGFEMGSSCSLSLRLWRIRSDNDSKDDLAECLTMPPPRRTTHCCFWSKRFVARVSTDRKSATFWWSSPLGQESADPSSGTPSAKMSAPFAYKNLVTVTEYSFLETVVLP